MQFVLFLTVITLVFFGSGFYISLRLYQGIKFILPKAGLPWLIFICALIVLPLLLGFSRSMLPVPASVKSILNVISATLMGVFVYWLLYTVASDIVRLILRLFNAIPKGFSFYSSIIVLVAMAVTVTLGFIHAGRIKQVSYEIDIEGKPFTGEINMVLISDLHLGAVGSESRLEDVVAAINALNPDIVCITGDIFDNDYQALRNPDRAEELLKSISAKYGVYACLGNHDSGKTVDKMLEFLNRSNVNVLNDEYVIIDNRFVLVGRLDYSPIGGYSGLKRSDTETLFKGIDTSLPVFVMDHNPANIDEYGEGIDLIISGHTHKGQIFPANLVTALVYNVDYGYYRKNASSPHVVVTSGAGTWGIPMRIGSSCEVAFIKIK